MRFNAARQELTAAESNRLKMQFAYLRDGIEAGASIMTRPTSSQSMMALLTGTRASAGRNDLNRLVM
jgi:hypothetical protein